VKTDRPIPKHLLLKTARLLAEECVSPPVKAGDVVVRDVLGTGADVVATSDLGGSCGDIDQMVSEPYNAGET